MSNNRIIKFRGKNENGDWVFGGVTADKYVILDEYTKCFVPVKRNTVGQFANFTDIDGNEVYEGDILLLADSDSNQRKGIVKFIYDCWYVHDVFSDKHKLFALFFVRTTMSAKIIGNIHDTESKKHAESASSMTKNKACSDLFQHV